MPLDWHLLRSTWLRALTSLTMRLLTITRKITTSCSLPHPSLYIVIYELVVPHLLVVLLMTLFSFFSHSSYVILGDGCQMEGISNEACSLAGHWGLGKLIAFYDDNHISIDGDTELAFTESVDQRFEGLGWHVIWVKNGNTGYDDIRAAIKEAKAVKDKPTLIKVSYSKSRLK